MDELLEKYMEMKEKVEHYEKNLKKYRNLIQEKMKKDSISTFENKEYKVLLKKLKRTTISKKDVPCTIWEKYSVCTPYNMVYIRDKSRKKGV